MGTARAAEAWFRRCGCRNRETGSLLGAQLEVLSGPAPAGARGLTTGEWLASWVSLRASTSRGYAAHVRGYLVPYLGGIPLAELSPADVQQYPPCPAGPGAWLARARPGGRTAPPAAARPPARRL